MPTVSLHAGGEPPTPWWRRLHRQLMPDYNRKASAYWWSVVALGALAIAHAALGVAHRAPADIVAVTVGVAVAALVGLFPVRVPGTKNCFAAGEIFIFSLLLMYGPAAATLASAGEALVGSWRASRRWSSRIASPAMAAVAMAATGGLLDAALAAMRARGWGGAPALFTAGIVFAFAYFVVNTLLVTLVPKLKRDEWITPAELFGHFGWAGIAYAGSVSVAILLYLAYQHSGAVVLSAGVPIVALLMATMHLYVRRQEADEALRASQARAAEREDEQSRRHVAHLQHIAFHDSLTGLPNRRRFHELLEQALQRVQAEPQRQFGVMFLDFDRFKLINDRLGHSAGDEFLAQIARRLQANLRPADIVARLGGDEFAILLEGSGCVDYSISLADRLQAALRQPLCIAGTEITTSASIGITSSEFGYASASDVLRDADIAMYRAKSTGKARYAMFDPGLRTAASPELTLEGELRAALQAQALSIEYQPLVSLSTGALLGFEALARWDHPRRRRVPPAEFIPVAEASGLIVPLTDFVLEHACRRLKRWQQAGPAFSGLTMHVNLSGSDLGHPDLASRVAQALGGAGLEARHLTLELTEDILVSRLERSLPTLEALHRAGVGLSVDDFGTGASSFAHLSGLPFDSLKIDRSFVGELDRGANAAIVSTIVYLAHALGKTVIAEGIETRAQLDALVQAGCEAGQGFHMAGALPAWQVDEWLEDLAARGDARGRPGGGWGARLH